MQFLKKKAKNKREAATGQSRAQGRTQSRVLGSSGLSRSSHASGATAASTTSSNLGMRSRSPRATAKRQQNAQKEQSGFAWIKQARVFLAQVNWGLFRIKLVVSMFVLLWVGLWGRAWYVQVLEGPRLADKASRQYMSSVLVTGKRGSIVDRNGQVLARSVESRSIYIRPQEVKDVQGTAAVLASILSMPAPKIAEQLGKKSRKFIWLARKVDDKTAMAVQQAKLSGIGLSKEYNRVYPFKQMAGHLLGFVGVDDQGLEGIERAFDEDLAAVPTRRTVQRDALGRRFFLQAEGQNDPVGKKIQLTLDSHMQFFAEEAITKAVENYGAAWGGVLVVDVESGDIMAWAQYPFFNPNSYRSYSPSQYRNRLATDALEPGSTLKPFLVAAAMQQGLVTKDTMIFCENGRWKTNKITIRDTSVRGNLTVSEILRYSSNIGVAKIGKLMGAETYHRYLKKLGFGERTVVPVAEHKGILRDAKQWYEADLLTTSFGQSISVTGVQMAQAYLTLINDGVYKPLRLVMNDDAPKPKIHRVFRKDVAQSVSRMLQDVVEEDGSGTRARIAGTKVAGKTGTAQKADKATGTYGDGRMASFVGFAPADNPRFLTLVMVDEPTKNQYGGVVAAPVFQEVTHMALMYDGQLPDVVFAEGSSVIKRGAEFDATARGFKMSRAPQPLFAMAKLNEIKRTAPYNTLPGQESKASSVVPNVVGKTVRNAVELFARGGIVPVLRGDGQRVVQQSPKAGTAWPEQVQEDNGQYYLQLSEN